MSLHADTFLYVSNKNLILFSDYHVCIFLSHTHRLFLVLSLTTTTTTTDLLISVFPYSGFLVVDLVESVNEENAGRYAGLVASSFNLGRALTSLSWGRIGDTYGRTTVIQASLLLSCFFSLLFGLAPSFWAAVGARFLLGCSNGIMSSLKTIVSELVAGGGHDEKQESRQMSLVIGMWGLGFLVSPALAGALAEPVRQYPDWTWWPKEEDHHRAVFVVKSVLERFPFLLPNILGAVLCLVSALLFALFVDETLATPRSPKYIFSDMCRRFGKCLPQRFQCYYKYDALPILKAHESNVDLNEHSEEEEELTTGAESVATPTTTTMASLWARRDTRSMLWVQWSFSFVGLTLDEALPLFLMSHTAGFGLVENDIGRILSLCGLLFVLTQYTVYSKIYDCLGLLGSVRLGAALSAPLILAVPVSVWINNHQTRVTEESTNGGGGTAGLHWQTVWYLGIVLALYRILTLAFFTSISVMVNRTVPTRQRATMNGLSLLGASVARGLGPLFAGVLVSQSVALLKSSLASVLIFAVISLLGAVVAAMTFLVLGHDEDSPESLEFPQIELPNTTPSCRDKPLSS